MEGPKVGWNTAPAIPYGSAPGSAGDPVVREVLYERRGSQDLN